MNLLDVENLNGISSAEGRRRGGRVRRAILNGICSGGGAAEGREKCTFFHVSDDTNHESSMVRGSAEGRRRGGGRAKIIEKRFEN